MATWTWIIWISKVCAPLSVLVLWFNSFTMESMWILYSVLCADKCCADLMYMAKEARKHRLGPLHPAYNLLQLVKESLLEMLPQDAHIRASGKLCVSLTKMSDGKNILVSQFDSRDELIQVNSLGDRLALWIDWAHQKPGDVVIIVFHNYLDS